MEILSFEGGSKPARKKRSLGFVIGAAVVAGVSVFGTTLASSVTIGSGAITFGQGLIEATACDSAITVTPSASFTNGATATGSFYLKTITLGDLADACDAKTFIVKAWNGTAGTSALTLWSGNSAISAAFNKSTPTSSTVTSGVTLTGSAASANAGTLVLTITNPTLDASTVSKITIEEQNQ